MRKSSHPPPARIDSWPAKSPDAKLDALLPLAQTIAKKIIRRCHGMRDEILAAATIGAWETVRRHPELNREDARRMAVVRVRGAILDELRLTDWVPRRIRREIKRGEIPPVPMLRLEHGFHEGELPMMTPDALVAPATQGDRLEAAEQADEDAALIFGAMESLSPRVRRVLVDYYYGGDRLNVIARRLGVSDPRASQLRKQGIAELRARLVKG